MLDLKKEKLIFHYDTEEVWIEPWGENALRVRATKEHKMPEENWALHERGNVDCEIVYTEQGARIINGKIYAEITKLGKIMIYNSDGKLLLEEYCRNRRDILDRKCSAIEVEAREFKPILGGDYHLTMRFESVDRDERIYGMGQYQQAYLDLKGCSLELAQRNSQASVPFAVSSLGYGFLWNHPGVGRATFGKNYTQWEAEALKQMDYWITVEDTPAKLVENYTEVTGRTPMIPDGVLGLWQCKLRYRTQEEVLSVARKYKELGIHIDVIVIDFFHWTRQGDWKFDKEYWPDPKAMCDELHAMGTKVVVSIWPSVDKKSENFEEMLERGLLIQTERGSIQTYEFQGDCLEVDVTNPEARQYLWEKCKKNYYDYGIDMFWLDNSEPDYGVYDYDNYRYQMGTALEVTNLYSKLYAKTFYDGIKEEGREKECLQLIRCGWAGSQKYAALHWSGDVPSTFESMRDQLSAGLNMGLAGIPWWTTDIGGFMTDDVEDENFKELLLRWFEFAVFTPILRMHGDRGPHNIPPLSDKDFGGGSLYTGHPNELWSYGREAFDIMKQQLDLRLSIVPYVEKLMQEASEKGAPLLRTMFYEFPGDPHCWELEDQYMFGGKYLVAPVFALGQREREVYLPEGKWKSLSDGEVCEGGKTIFCKAPLTSIPVFERLSLFNE